MSNVACIKCGKEKVSAESIQERLNGIMQRCNDNAHRMAEEDKAKGTVEISGNAYLGVMLDMAMKSFVERLKDTCKCEALKPKRAKRPTTWTKCTGPKQHKIMHAEGACPVLCPRCKFFMYETGKSGGAA